MPSTFFGLTIAGSGLFAAQTSINTAANNVSNVNTKGYTRQETVQNAADALRVYQPYGLAGAGVTVDEITQIRNLYYDVKYWENNAKLGQFDTQNYYLRQLEAYFKDDGAADANGTTGGVAGFGTIFDNMSAAMSTLAGNPSDVSYRNQFINYSQSFTNYFNDMYQVISRLQNDCNEMIRTKVSEVNSIAQEVALLNKQINLLEQKGGKANELRDKRALLVDQLSAIVPVEVKETKVRNSNYPEMYTGGTDYVIKINGQTLVNTDTYNTMECVARENKVNQTDVEGLYDVVWSNELELNLGNSTMTGELKALYDFRDGNNGENFRGTVSACGTVQDASGRFVSTLTIAKPSITEVNKMTMAEQGVITVNNRTYNYTQFTYDFKNQTYTFQLDGIAVADEVLNKKAAIGEDINFMGIPYYMSQMNEFIREFSRQFNEIHTKGQTLPDGEKAGLFFTGKDINGNDYTKFDDRNLDDPADPDDRYLSSREGKDGFYSYYSLTAENFCVATEIARDPEKMATTSNIDAGYEKKDILDDLNVLYNKTPMFRGGTAGGFLECVLADLAIDSKRAKSFRDNYTNISNSIINQRLSVSGVDEDEEAMDLVKFQHAYNLASKMIQTMTELYDRLILETGV